MNDKRIMMISTHGYVGYPPELGRLDTGGQVTFVIELSRKLGELGYAVDIFTRRFEAQPPIDEVSENVRIVRIPYGGPKFIRKEDMRPHMPEFVANTLDYTGRRRLKYDYINSHYWDAGLAGMLIGQRMRVRHFHTPHSLGIWKKENMRGDAAENERRWKFAARLEVEHDIYQKARRVIATTVQQEEILAKRYHVPATRIVVIPPGFDEELFVPEAPAQVERVRRRLRLPKRFVLSMGRLARNKGYDLLVRAFGFLVDRELISPEVHLVLAIGGQELGAKERKLLADLKRLTRKLHIQRRVHWLGYVEQDDMPAVYDCAAVFVMPSRYEPFGMVAVEAMACGTPTVVTTEGGLRREMLFGRDVLYANPFKTEEFAVTMALPLNYPEIAERLCRRGSIAAHSEYTWISIARRTLNIYRER